MNENDFIRFKHESYLLKLKQYARNENLYDKGYIYFGGTGAVGGQAVIETIQSLQYMYSVSTGTKQAEGILLITGISPNEVTDFCGKLYGVFGKMEFEELNLEDQPDDCLKILKMKNGLQLEFYKLMAKPAFKKSLKTIEKENPDKKQLVKVLQKEASKMTAPFEEFVKQYKKHKGFKSGYRFKAVISGIPIPSVATYHFGEIDLLLERVGIQAEDQDKSIERSIKIQILKGLAQDFGDIKTSHADEVLIAHTTSVGGMYTIVNGKPVIKLGFAHSALGDLLKEKQFYANQLTIQYSSLGLKTLITAAAIGIDYIYDNRTLPLNKGILNRYHAAESNKELPFDIKLLTEEKFKKNEKVINRIFKGMDLAAFHPVLDAKGKPASKAPVEFSSSKLKLPQMKVKFALRSGENGLFSLDNAYALYLCMKIATQEELAHILVYGALFGDDAQKPWFDENNICYKTESENSMLVLSLLANRAEFRKYQTSAFTPKAFQDLGSSKHQGELHTLGMYILLHRLKALDPELVSRKITSKYRDSEVMEFVDRNTRPLLIEEIATYDPKIIAKDFTRLLTLKDAQDLADFVNYKGQIKTGFIKTFFQHLFNVIQQTIHTITSLGTPIIYHDEHGKDRILCGPYLAPANIVASSNYALVDYIEKESKEHNLDPKDFYEWMISNQGFADLRPKAVISTAKSHKDGLDYKIIECQDIEDFKNKVIKLQKQSTRNIDLEYFTSSGIVAFVGRIMGLNDQLQAFDISLGTYNGWKALFPIDGNFNHPVIPGIVEAMRMYAEGLGKITGTEMAYPKFGYF